MNKSFILFLMLLISGVSVSQTRITDSLKLALDQTKHDTTRVRIMYEISMSLRSTNANQAINYANSAIELSEKIKYDKYIDQLLVEAGIMYNRTGELQKSTAYYFKALKQFEKKNNKTGIGKIYNNLGLISVDQGRLSEAIQYYKKSINIRREINDSAGLAKSLHNMGITYFQLGKYDSALTFLNTSVEIKNKLGDLRGKSVSYNIIGDIYRVLEKYDKAFYFLSESLKIKEQLQDSMGIANSYASIGAIYKYKFDYGLAKSYFQKCLAISTRFNNKFVIKDMYSELSQIEYSMGNSTMAYNYLLKELELNGQIYKEQSEKQISELKIQYDTEKKEQENINLKKDQLLKEHEINQKRNQNLLLLLIILLMFVLVIYVLISRKKLKSAYLQLEKASIEIKNQKEEIEIQATDLQKKNIELNYKNSEISEQKTIIEKKNSSITSSITYASRIQHAILPDTVILNNCFSDSFIFYKPRDIVSGDFYFLKQINQHFLIAAADCTGHGVPGAFMSMLGMALLTEIVRKEEVTTAAVALDLLREYVKTALQQTGQKGEQQDGMDIALLAINLHTLEADFAGAHNPLWIVKQNTNHENSSSVNFVLEEIKGDRMPIGIFPREKPFSNHKIQLQKNDLIYVFSDGYESQFGGTNGDKLKLSKMKEIVISVANNQMQEQQVLLDHKLNEWKGNWEQIDDILIIGAKI